jgi:hypothetical protein
MSLVKNLLRKVRQISRNKAVPLEVKGGIIGYKNYKSDEKIIYEK